MRPVIEQAQKSPETAANILRNAVSAASGDFKTLVLTALADSSIDVSDIAGLPGSSTHANMVNAISMIYAYSEPAEYRYDQREPSTTDDITKGIMVGTSWVDQSSGRVYDCSDNTINNAVWQDTFQTVGLDIQGLTEKVTPVAGDMLVVSDSEAAGALKKLDIDNLPSGGSGFLTGMLDFVLDAGDVGTGTILLGMIVPDVTRTFMIYNNLIFPYGDQYTIAGATLTWSGSAFEVGETVRLYY